MARKGKHDYKLLPLTRTRTVEIFIWLDHKDIVRERNRLGNTRLKLRRGKTLGGFMYYPETGCAQIHCLANHDILDTWAHELVHFHHNELVYRLNHGIAMRDEDLPKLCERMTRSFRKMPWANKLIGWSLR